MASASDSRKTSATVSSICVRKRLAAFSSVFVSTRSMAFCAAKLPTAVSRNRKPPSLLPSFSDKELLEVRLGLLGALANHCPGNAHGLE